MVNFCKYNNKRKVYNKMLNIYEVAETNKMIEKENLDVRTITLGISLLDCIDSDLDKLNEKIYNKIGFCFV